LSGAILLGAGFSRRFGSDKRQHRVTLPDGSAAPMLAATAAIYVEAFDETVVVLRAEDDALRTALGHLPHLRTVVAARATLGMGHSLAAGIRAAAGWDYAFVGLGDMPFVSLATLTLLRGAMEDGLGRGNRGLIVMPVHAGRPGHPVGFAATYFPALATLTGDAGAREVVTGAAGEVLRLEVSDAGVLQDLDEPP